MSAPHPSEFAFIYITTKDKPEAMSIARTLVQERLAASANVFDNMEAIYWWGDEIYEVGEVVLIAMTRASLVDELTERVKSMHSYNCPCIVAMPMTNGNPAYFSWMAHESRATVGV
jgi:periplasmic divalent cation tolerance protein